MRPRDLIVAFDEAAEWPLSMTAFIDFLAGSHLQVAR
jgi:hypothetical protein